MKKDPPLDRPVRSQKYQYKMVEIAVNDDYLTSFTNGSSIESLLNPWIYSEERLELKDQLMIELKILIEENCTTRQKEVYKLICDGYTQDECAKILKVNQSSIVKCILGNVDYGSGKKHAYGGIVKKLQTLINKNEKILLILKQMSEYQEEKY